MGLQVAYRIALAGPLTGQGFVKAVPAILAARALTGASTLSPYNQHHARQLHTSPQRSAPNSGLMGISSSNTNNGSTSYFARPRLPANTIVRFVPQQTAWVVERMGKFNRILEPGLAILVPFLDRISYVKSLKESALEIPSQSAITADNVTLELDGVLYTRVVDAYKAR